ncbi:MAG: hypothetical protein KDD62_07490 [Bdellovibrionales bacterium]|nr:hypothetical protein [Bdellovibrionales bacterium]
MRFVFLVLFGLGVVAYQSDLFIEYAKVEVELNQKLVTATTDNNYFEFDVLGKEKQDFRVVSYGRPHSSIRAMGARKEVVVLNEADYEEYAELRAAGECVASFLNQHAIPILMIPAGDNALKELNREFKEADSIGIEGYPLNVSYVEYKGNEVADFSMYGAEVVLVDDVYQLVD